MPTLREAVTDSVRDFMCGITQPTADFANYLDGAISAVPGNNIGGLPGNDISQGIRGLICPGPSGGGSGGTSNPVYPPPSFQPGQCDLEAYNITYSYTQPSGTRTTSPVNGLLGPIGEIVVSQLSSGNFRAQIECRGFVGGNPQPFPFLFTLLSNITNSNFDPVLETVVRADGQPDECGPMIPGGPPTGNDTIDYDDPDGVPVVGAPITISPTIPIVLPGGQVIIPIEVCLLAFCIDLDFNLSTGDITFNIGGQAGGEVCCPPLEDGPDDNDDDAPPEPTSDERYWGVKVNFDASASNFPTVKQQPGSEAPIYLPDVALIRFAVEVGGVRAWTPAQKVQTNPQFVPVNVPATAYAYDVFKRPGVTLSVKPVIVKSASSEAE